MKKKIVWGILLFIIVALCASGYIFRKEIKLVYNFLLVPAEKIEEKHQTKKQELKESLLGEYEVDETLADGFTKEEIEKISKGEITVEEAMERVLKSKKDTTPQKEDNTAKINQAVSDATAEMYRLQGVYYAKLGALEGEVISFYNAQISSGATKNRAKSLVISTFSGRLYAMEAEADGAVEGVLSTLSAKLKQFGGDTSIVSKMRKEYESQKTAKIVQYKQKIG